MVRWGIVGTGRIAHKFAKDLLGVHGAIPAAVASRSPAKAQAFAEAYGISRAFGTYEDLAQSQDVDVVYIASPHSEHRSNTNLYLKNRIAVLCEKPIGIDMDEAKDMIQTAKQHNTFLMEALWTRFMPGCHALLDIIKDGKIGTIQFISANFGFKAEADPTHRVLNPRLGGGALLDIGIYPAFLAYLLMGVPDHISAICKKGETGVDVSTDFTFSYSSGVEAKLYCTFEKTTSNEAIIKGTKGHIKIHSRFHEMPAFNLLDQKEGHKLFNFPRTSFGYNYEIEAVNDCILNNQKEHPQWTWQDSTNLMSILDRTRKSAGIHYDL